MGALQLWKRPDEEARPRPYPRPDGRFEILHAENLGDELRLYWRDGYVSHFLAIWLRESVDAGGGAGPDQCPPLVEPDAVSLERVEIDGNARRLAVEFGPEGLTRSFDAVWLREHSYDEWNRHTPAQQLWDHGLEVPTASAAQIFGEPESLRAWLEAVRDFGVARIRDLPGDAGLAAHVIKQLGLCAPGAGTIPCIPLYAREHAPQRVGAEQLLRTAQPFRDPVPGLRALHCRDLDDPDAKLHLVDAFHVAERLRADCPVYFELLSRHEVPFFYNGPSAALWSRHRVVETDDGGCVSAVCYNPRRTAPFDLSPQVMRDYYRAYRRFQTTLRQPSLTASFTLAVGDLWLIDNHRILHGVAGCATLEYAHAERDYLAGRCRLLGEEPAEVS